jgi:tetratricopeptide (TPR) repeat protein
MSTAYLRVASVLLLAAAVAAPAAAQEAPRGESIDQKVSRLIEQLGASDFSTRENAQAELAKLGLAAFDALNEAQHHDDIEIALRARFLVRSMQVKWYEESDPLDVQRILKGYGEQSETERRSRIDRLATLPGGDGLTALCRLARFELSEELAKLAALRVLQQPEPADAEAKGKLARQIEPLASGGKRTAVTWLRTYAQTLVRPEATIEQWRQLVKQEHDLLAQFPERTSREIVRDLYRFQAVLNQQLGRRDEAIAVLRQSLSLVEGTPQQLAEVMDWLIARSAWEVVQELADRYPQAFQESADLLYRQAEALRKQNATEKAERLAAQALAMSPETPEAHHRLARHVLQGRGLFDWAEREYRLAMKAPPTSRTFMQAHLALAEMLHDMGKERPAAEVLRDGVETLRKEVPADQLASELVGAWQSRMRYFFALDHMEKGEPDQALAELKKAIEADPTDADVLIALYRHPQQSEADKQANRTLIESAVRKFREEMNDYKAQVEQAPSGEAQRYYSEALANACNQLAWLVGNTFGDVEEAIRCSHKSIELKPDDNAAYYDTLGRCYYAKGDFDSAIKYQSQALAQEPHSGQMKRQLDFFLKEREARKAAPRPQP